MVLYDLPHRTLHLLCVVLALRFARGVRGPWAVGRPGRSVFFGTKIKFNKMESGKGILISERCQR